MDRVRAILTTEGASMLNINRCHNDRLLIGNNIEMVVLSNSLVKLGFDGPKWFPIVRKEISGTYLPILTPDQVEIKNKIEQYAAKLGAYADVYFDKGDWVRP